MATIQDIANQINNTLTQINQNTQDTANTLALIKGDTADLKSRVDTLNTDLSSRLDSLFALNQAGFLLLGQGVFLMLEQLRRANSLLEGQVRQNQAMLCWFENLADLLCRILHRQNNQVALQSEIEQHIERLRKLSEIVHPDALGELERLERIEAALRACCPPKPDAPEPCPERCPSPTIEPYQPRDDPDWSVPGQPNQPGIDSDDPIF